MSRSAVSVFVFAVYMFLLGLILIIIPNTLLRLFSLPESNVREVHVWTDRPLKWWPQGIGRPAGTPPATTSGFSSGGQSSLAHRSCYFSSPLCLPILRRPCSSSSASSISRPRCGHCLP